MKTAIPPRPAPGMVAYDRRYGRLELAEVIETSDGFLIGQALIGEPDDPDRYSHSVFLGRAEDFS